MGLLVSFIWAAKSMLNESSLNFSAVIIVAVMLCEIYIILSTYFSAVQNEFGPILPMLETIISSSLPLIASSLLTWFFCAEIPSLDIVIFFSVCYFFHTQLICRPKYVSRYGYSTKKDDKGDVDGKVLLIPLRIMKTVYVLPVIVSFAIHLAVHHNVLSTGRTWIVNTAVAIFLPTILMCYSAMQQIEYWPIEQRESVTFRLRLCIYFVCALFLLAGQDHPIFDELKSFSGLPTPIPSILLLGSIFSVFIALILYRMQSKIQKLKEDDDEEIYTSSSQSKRVSGMSLLISIFVSFFVGVSALLLSVLVNIPYKTLPICVIGAVSLAEVYHRKTWALLPTMLLIFIAGLSISVVSLSFAYNTVYYVSCDFSWGGLQLTMKQFSKAFSLSLAFATILPTLVVHHGKTATGSVLPSAGTNTLNSSTSPQSNYEFGFKIVEFFTPWIVFSFALSEIMIREKVNVNILLNSVIEAFTYLITELG